MTIKKGSFVISKDNKTFGIVDCVYIHTAEPMFSIISVPCKFFSNYFKLATPEEIAEIERRCKKGGIR